MKYKQYLTIDDFYESSYNDPEKFDTRGPATEYKWKEKMNHLSPNVAQKLKSWQESHHERHPSNTSGHMFGNQVVPAVLALTTERLQKSTFISHSGLRTIVLYKST